MTPRIVSMVVLCAAVTGCGGRGDQASEETQTQPGAESSAEPSSEVATTYASELNVDLTQMRRSETGLYTRDLQEGTGDPVRSGQTVAVHYTGWLPNGTQFDRSREGGEPLTVTLGEGQVIAGWDQGIVGMRRGGRRQLVIPPSLAYGNRAMGEVIPAGSTLVFDVELVEIR